MKEIPPVLFRRILTTLLLGGLFLLAGFAGGLALHDRILLWLSLFIFVMCLWKAAEVYIVARKGEFEIVTGTCRAISPAPLRRCRKVQIEDSQGVVTTLRLDKRVRLRIGQCYHFYFHISLPSGSDRGYLDVLLQSGLFLGVQPAEAETEDTFVS